VGELATALGALLDDPERRREMGMAGRLRALECYSWRSVAVATAKAYDRAVAETCTDTRRGSTLAHR
jgi:glycosyltransferase involved in cell wall biosynthesis